MKQFTIYKGDNEVREVNDNLYEILKKLPPVPKKITLTTDQKFWYKYFGDQLVNSNKLTKPDIIHLVRLAKSVDYYVQAEREIEAREFIGGLVQVYKGGATNISGFMVVREKMLKDIDELSKHFGFSFKDRSKLKEAPTSDPAQLDVFNQFANQKQG